MGIVLNKNENKWSRANNNNNIVQQKKNENEEPFNGNFFPTMFHIKTLNLCINIHTNSNNNNNKNRQFINIISQVWAMTNNDAIKKCGLKFNILFRVVVVGRMERGRWLRALGFILIL